MSMWFGRLFGRRRSASPADLESFLGRHSAFVAQKTVLDYCRVKAGRQERTLFADPAFRAALEHCRWQTFGAVVGDLCALTEAWLRPHAVGAEPQLAEGLAAIGARLLAAAEAPAGERENLAASAAALPMHLARLQMAPSRATHRMVLLAEAPLLATLPIHPDQRIGETPAIKGALRFHVVSCQQEMERAFDAPVLAAALSTR
jgi:hypothetical protein